MTVARPKEGPRAPLFYSGLVLVCAGLAQAQTVELSELEQCAALASAAEKLACFEAIAAGNEVATEVASAAPPVPDGGAAPVAEGSSEPAAPLASAPEEAAGSLAAQSPASQAPLEAPAPMPATANAVPLASSDDSFGREYLESVEESRSQEMTATVVDVTKTYHGELVFHLDNDQVWAQIEKRYYPYPKNQQFDVVISIGVLNEYQLQVGGVGRKATVKRVK